MRPPCYVEFKGTVARQPYEGDVFSVKVSFVRKKCARDARVRGGPAWNPRIFGGALSVDQWTVIFRGRLREAAPVRTILSSVDSGGQVDSV